MTKILIQCDFDGTVTDEDVSFLLLDAFSDIDWREYFSRYQEGKITVGRFNRLAFGTVKASRREMLDYIRGKFSVRRGFKNLARLCRQKGFRFVIVSNGLDFYIEEVLKAQGLSGLEFHAAKTGFDPQGLKVQYIGPDGTVLDSDFKDSYVSSFLNEGNRVIYIGDGRSDLAPAKRCHHIFARESLLERCQQNGIACTPFVDFNDIIRTMESW
jgi:2-hydroxy-3-keto-5-methylthiopentenyl-1-phosphate phosphatase